MQPFKKKTVNCESVKGCMFKRFFCLFWGLWRNLHRFTIHSLFLSPCKEQEEGSLESSGFSARVAVSKPLPN